LGVNILAVDSKKWHLPLRWGEEVQGADEQFREPGWRFQTVDSVNRFSMGQSDFDFSQRITPETTIFQRSNAS